MFHYCDCPKTERERKRKNSSRVPMSTTKVDEEGICIHCGHYAVATRELKNSISLYKFIAGPIKPSSQRKVTERAGTSGSAGRWQDYYDEHRLGSY